MHVLEQPEVALPLAQENWLLQKEPWDARLLLEAALATGEPVAARAALDQLAKDKTDHAWLRRLAARLERHGQ